MIINAALVLEGGAMRGVYTSGVLDVMLDHGIEFSYVIAVSAGALNGANFVSKQAGRSARINIMHSNDRNYYGLFHFFRSRGNIFNFDYLYNKPINELYPYDLSQYHQSSTRFIITATDCNTGKPIYFEADNYVEMTKALTASSSMPLLSKIYAVDGYDCLDGGISEPICLNKALSDGFKKIILVLTRDKSYRKEPTSFLMKNVYKTAYKRYPELVKSLISSPENYNRVVDQIDKLEAENQIFVIRPESPLSIGRAEKNVRRLLTGYFRGRDDMKNKMDDFIRYLGE